MKRPDVHTCTTRTCWHEHATDPGTGHSRCLWGSRDGTHPRPRGSEVKGPFYCSQPHRAHEGPHTFDLRLRLPTPPGVTRAAALGGIAGGIAGGGLGVLLRALAGAL